MNMLVNRFLKELQGYYKNIVVKYTRNEYGIDTNIRLEVRDVDPDLVIRLLDCSYEENTSKKYNVYNTEKIKIFHIKKIDKQEVLVAEFNTDTYGFCMNKILNTFRSYFMRFSPTESVFKNA